MAIIAASTQTMSVTCSPIRALGVLTSQWRRMGGLPRTMSSPTPGTSSGLTQLCLFDPFNHFRRRRDPEEGPAGTWRRPPEPVSPNRPPRRRHVRLSALSLSRARRDMIQPQPAPALPSEVPAPSPGPSTCPPQPLGAVHPWLKTSERLPVLLGSESE